MLSTPGPSRGPSRPRDRDRDRERTRATARGTPRHREREERAGTPPVPTYEPPAAPLNEVGRTALLSLLRSQALRQLRTHIQHAELKLTESAGEVNERLTDAKLRLNRQREREQERVVSRSMTEVGDGEANESKGANMDVDGGVRDGGKEGEAGRVKELEESVKDITGRLDGSMRRAIDSEVRTAALEEVLGGLQREVEAEINANAGVQRQRRRLRARGSAAGEEEENEEEDDGDLYEATPEVEIDGDQISLSHKLEERMAEDREKWEDLSLTERYSKNNNYIGFYRIVHEAKHPSDEIPPLPHASTWFSHLEDPNAVSKRRNSSARPSRRNTRQQRARSASAASDSDDLAIERERISLKCPLTLLPFKDPVTSTKCPHSFEREAIADMITRSSMTVPAPSASGPSAGPGGRNRRIRAVKCPVCSGVLTGNDLREDPVLLRRIRRADAAKRRDHEEEEEADLLSGRRKSRQSGIMLPSDDDPGLRGSGGDRMDIDQVRVKQERVRSRGITKATDDEQRSSASGSETEEDPDSNGGSDEE
ncbi:SUMO ligase MMS21 [Aspergillus lucknowensis]|uniref:Zinc-finger of the MIZ type in Nse subunit-domain-containing protein n=1 Tax=Aspergillus lucknowensis TaxID=176173 RepID=A0ABR4M107_9EURO